MNLPFNIGDRVLDIGCGNGNLFSTFARKLGQKGELVGVDKSKELLSEAEKRKIECGKELIEFDMNKPLPFANESFEHVVSVYAIYYVDDVSSISLEIKRVLKNEGRFLLIGPAQNNAKELNDFNKSIFNIGRDEIIFRRTNRLEDEFYPFLKTIFGKVRCEKIPSRMIFPSKEEFINYYMATLLFEESVAKTGIHPDFKSLCAKKGEDLEISKEMIAVSGEKYE